MFLVFFFYNRISFLSDLFRPAFVAMASQPDEKLNLETRYQEMPKDDWIRYFSLSRSFFKYNRTISLDANSSYVMVRELMIYAPASVCESLTPDMVSVTTG